MTVDNQTLLTALTIIAGSSGIGSILVAIFTRRRTKADALKVIQEAAAAQVVRMQDEAESWRAECIILRDEIDTLRGRVDENDACQTTLKKQIETLEGEKRSLMDEVVKLKTRIDYLEAENRRLKENR